MQEDGEKTTSQVLLKRCDCSGSGATAWKQSAHEQLSDSCICHPSSQAFASTRDTASSRVYHLLQQIRKDHKARDLGFHFSLSCFPLPLPLFFSLSLSTRFPGVSVSADHADRSRKDRKSAGEEGSEKRRREKGKREERYARSEKEKKGVA